MFSMPRTMIARHVRALKARLGNLPEAEMKVAFEKGLEDQWSKIMGKAENYVQGPDVLTKGGHFSAASCGNWFLIADAAGVDRVPAEVISVVSPTLMLDIHTNLFHAQNDEQRDAFFARSGDAFTAFVNDLQNVQPHQVIRYDTGADSRLKEQIALGRSSGDVPAFKGYRKAGETILPDFDERVVRQLMENPENSSPVWVRDWVSPVMAPGDRNNGFSYIVKSADLAQAEDPMTPQDTAGEVGVEEERADYGDAHSEGNLFPREWRVFIKDGEIKAIGNYYTQTSRAQTPEDEADAAHAVMEIWDAAEKILAVVRERKAIPHHPQYEDDTRKNFDPDAIHFTMDFMEVADPAHPLGRRLTMIDAGVGHLRNPPFGAHPVSFGGAKEPEGVAFALGDVRSFDEVRAIAQRSASASPAP